LATIGQLLGNVKAIWHRPPLCRAVHRAGDAHPANEASTSESRGSQPLWRLRQDRALILPPHTAIEHQTLERFFDASKKAVKRT